MRDTGGRLADCPSQIRFYPASGGKYCSSVHNYCCPSGWCRGCCHNNSPLANLSLDLLIWSSLEYWLTWLSGMLFLWIFIDIISHLPAISHHQLDSETKYILNRYRLIIIVKPWPQNLREGLKKREGIFPFVGSLKINQMMIKFLCISGWFRPCLKI